MYYYSFNTFKVSRRYFLPCAWIYIFVFWNLCGHAETKIIENSSSTNASHPSSLLISSLSSNKNSSYSSPPSHHEVVAAASVTSPRFSKLLNKINLQNESHVIAQLVQTGTANLHKLLQKLKRITSNPYNNATIAQYAAGTKVTPGKTLLGVNKIASSIPSFITNNTRLKRQLEGIFHVRGTSTSTPTTSRPILTTIKAPFQSLTSRPLRYRPPNGSIGGGGVNVVKRFRKVGHGGKNTHNGTNSAIPSPSISSSPKKEIEQTPSHQKNKEDQKISTITNFHSKKSNTHQLKDADLVDVGDVAQDLNGKRNFSLEIVEIARKTVITEDNSGKYRPTFRPALLPHSATPTDGGSQTNNATGQNSSKINFRPKFQPRIRKGNFHGKIPVSKSFDSTPVSATPTLIKKPSSNIFQPSIKYKPSTSNHDFATSSTTTTPQPIPERSSSSNSPNTFHIPSTTPRKKQYGTVEVNVHYQEQIPYNDRDVDEADLKDYLDGHSTFGSKGDFKHVVLKNVTGYLPNSQDNTKSVKHGLHKKQPSVAQNSPLQQRRSRSRESLTSNNEVEVEAVPVKQHNPVDNSNQRNNKAAIYTATGVPVLDQEDKAIYKYSGNKDSPHHFPKLPKSTLDALYKQGHPAIAKAPVVEPYGNSAPEDYNPFRANPLVDDVPLKYDPESDRFYGNPTPDKEKLAQSNRPEPNRVQIESDQAPEYQEEEQKKPPPSQSLSRRSSEGNGDQEIRNNDSNQNDNQNENQNDNRNDNQNDKNNPYFERVYEPPQDDYNERNVENEADSFIKDFVSLDNNFQPLPRPTRDEENFKGLIAPEARNEDDDQHFEPDNARNKNRVRGSDEDRDSNPRRNNDRYEEDREEDDHGEDYATIANDEDFGPTGPTDDFDKSYVDALKQFDDEIKQIQDNERNGITTTGNPSPHHPPPTSTGEPLVITSPGPAVSYQQQRNAPPPPVRNQMTTPTHEQQEPEEPEQEEEEVEEGQNQHQRRDPPQEPEEERGRGEQRSGNGGSNQEEEEEEPAEEEEEKPTPKKAEEEEESEEEGDADDKSKDADESQQVKINKVVEVKSDGSKPRDDKSGNLDEDISKIEEEWRRPPRT